MDRKITNVLIIIIFTKFADITYVCVNVPFKNFLISKWLEFDVRIVFRGMRCTSNWKEKNCSGIYHFFLETKMIFFVSKQIINDFIQQVISCHTFNQIS